MSMDGIQHWVITMLEALLPLDYSSLKDLLGSSPPAEDFVREFVLRRFGLDSETHKNCNEAIQHSVVPNDDKSSLIWTKQYKTNQKDSFTRNVITCTGLDESTTSSESTMSLAQSSSLAPSDLSDSLQSCKTKSSLGILTSELGVKKPKTSYLKLDSLSDIDSALKRLELDEIKLQGQKKCYCQARKHPLNNFVPNCLMCGKIICIVEGINPCSFCGTPLISREQQMNLVKQLRTQRSYILGQHSKKATIGKDTKQLYSTCYIGCNSINKDEFEKKAQDAEKDKNRLLELDRTNISNKIIDKAADFDPFIGFDRWESSSERFLMLERQRKALAAMNTPKKKIMKIDFSGKVTIETQNTDEEDNVDNNFKKESDISFSEAKHFHACFNDVPTSVFVPVERTIVKNPSEELDYIFKTGISRVQDDRDE
ncbi:hypothetical protein PCANB_001821 [Pneumocystis canis]|nr:hypothetical protein PCANB_001821 [Pneumocystis canis]